MSPEAAAGTLEFLQSELHAIYGVEAPRVHGFLLGLDAARAAGASPRAPEELLVLEEEDGIAVGLYLAEEVIAGAARADPPSYHQETEQLLERPRVVGILREPAA